MYKRFACAGFIANSGLQRCAGAGGGGAYRIRVPTEIANEAYCMQSSAAAAHAMLIAGSYSSSSGSSNGRGRGSGSGSSRSMSSSSSSSATMPPNSPASLQVQPKKTKNAKKGKVSRKETTKRQGEHEVNKGHTSMFDLLFGFEEQVKDVTIFRAQQSASNTPLSRHQTANTPPSSPAPAPAPSSGAVVAGTIPRPAASHTARQTDVKGTVCSWKVVTDEEYGGSSVMQAELMVEAAADAEEEEEEEEEDEEEDNDSDAEEEKNNSFLRLSGQVLMTSKMMKKNSVVGGFSAVVGKVSGGTLDLRDFEGLEVCVRTHQENQLFTLNMSPDSIFDDDIFQVRIAAWLMYARGSLVVSGQVMSSLPISSSMPTSTRRDSTQY